MSSLKEAAAASAKGGFTLFVGNTVALLVSAAGAILVARLLSPSEYGLFAVSLVLPGLFLLFSGWGVDSALVRFIAQYRSEDRPSRIKGLEFAGFVFKLAVGSVLSLALFLSADLLAAVVLKRPEAGVFVRAASLMVLSQSMYSSVISVLAGLERMDYRAAVNVVQAVVKGACSPLLVYLGYGVSGAVIGQVLGLIAASSIGFLFVISSTSKLGNPDEDILGFSGNLRLILGFGLPLFLGGLVSGFASRLIGLLLSWFVSDNVIGNYNVASRFTALIGLVTGSIGVTLFPTFSKFSHASEPEQTREAFQGSVRYSAIVVLPLTLLLMTVSKPAIYTLFTSKYPEAPIFFALLLIPMMYVGTGSLSLSSFLNSQGDTGTTMKINLISSILSIVLSPILVWIWNIYGLMASIIISGFFGNILGLLVLRKKYSISPNLKHTGRTLLCSTISAVFSYGAMWFLPSSVPLFNLFVGSAIFLALFLVLAPLTGTLEMQDIKNIDSMLVGLGIIYPFARFVLDAEEKILQLILRGKNRVHI